MRRSVAVDAPTDAMAVREAFESDKVRASTTAPTKVARNAPMIAAQRTKVPEESENPSSHWKSEVLPVMSMREFCRRSPSSEVGGCGRRSHMSVAWVFMASGLTPSALAAVLRPMRAGIWRPRELSGALIAVTSSSWDPFGSSSRKTDTWDRPRASGWKRMMPLSRAFMTLLPAFWPVSSS